jgi:hypothetical protein
MVCAYASSKLSDEDRLASENRIVGPRPDIRDLDLVCRRFADAWENGERPHIEHYLTWLPHDASAELLPRLIQLEMDFRRRGGEDPKPEEYEGRFEGVRADSQASATATQSLADTTVALLEKTGLWDAKNDTAPWPLRCPNCHSPVPGEHRDGEATTCPGCGSRCAIQPVGAATLTAELRVLGRFQLVSKVGQGAFGAVWRARDTS